MSNKPAKNIRPLRKLWPFLRQYKKQLAYAGIALVLAASATLALPVALRFLIDAGFSGDNSAQINQQFSGLLLLAVLLGFATATRYYFVTWIGERLVADIRNAVYQHILKLSPVFFESTRTGEVLSRLTTDTTLIQSVIGSSLSIALRNALTFAGGLTMLFVTSPKLTAIILLVIPLVLIPIIVFGRRVRTLSRASQDTVADTSSLAQEVLNAMQTVQAYTAEGYEAKRYETAVENAFSTALRRIRTRAVLTLLVILLVFAAVVGVLWIGAQAVISGSMTPGLLGQFLLYAIFTAGAVGALSETWGELQRAAGATERLVEILDTRPEIQAPADASPMPSNLRGEVHFEGINFSYPSRPDIPVLKDFELHIKAGETVALVGPSGAGKTTVFQLLLRFYDPQSGSIKLDNTAITDCDPATVRQHLGLVPQEPIIFAASAADNIRYGNENASDEQVNEAAQHAAADDFIQQQPEGYNTFLGERGMRLSGGQKQRIAIARAMLKNAEVVLLDEATSALDAESEQLVHQALDELTENRTTLVIAHRLATVREADRIVVMENGQVIATGKHEELVKQGGLYARLAKLQFKD